MLPIQELVQLQQREGRSAGRAGWPRAGRIARLCCASSGWSRWRWRRCRLLLFGQVSVVGLLANLLAIPWVTLVVTPLAMLGVLCRAAVGRWRPGRCSGWTLCLQWLARWPWATVSARSRRCGRGGRGAGRRAAGAAPALALARCWAVPLLLPVLLWQPPRPPPGQFELLAADVGQGNAVLVRTASHSLLYDTGPRFSRESDAGHRVLVPLLRALGERLDIAGAEPPRQRPRRRRAGGAGDAAAGAAC